MIAIPYTDASCDADSVVLALILEPGERMVACIPAGMLEAVNRTRVNRIVVFAPERSDFERGTELIKESKVLEALTFLAKAAEETPRIQLAH